ncbi:hypothetical protein SDRG_16758 [Saprolegnia diclina VS20]|uniref:Uncharacterized protein n=1 Tax=Saprolegnia diclina (strain VS20) TaxID=1156394 RepID=T0R779_SAPDV|nr:hypothetical protein SDRG_16758 [Saprolegnia diclina VS20]EQC25347.1 hypothetical protein SDRG_16758 [Saprolegnia diclina VS20]|eukprot:XP_008621197.1 hypothetical protein SDRG_16758 [Saprolegnia diclina VS20]
MPLVGPRAWAQGLRLPATNSASGVTVTAAPPSTFGSPSIGVSGKPSDKGSKKLEAFGRIFSNLLAGGLILLSLFTLIVLINQGMFSRLVISNNVQSAASFWSDYGKACQLTHHGWVAQSCSQNEVTTTSPTVWAAVGDRLADQWSLELDQGAPLFVSTCVVGGNKAVGWGVLVFVAGYTTYPDCVPLNGPQLIAGIALLETTVRNDQGVYLLTLYSDLNTTMQTVHEYTNSDGTQQGVLPYPLRTVVTTDGSYSYDATGEDFVILSTPLGLRYTVNVYCLSQIQVVSDFGLPGWSQGKHGGVPLSPAWACGNEVDSASELIAIQVLLIVLTVLALNGDVYITFEGLSFEKGLNGIVPYNPKQKHGSTFIVSVYWLGLAILPQSCSMLRPFVAGTVAENHFKPNTAEHKEKMDSAVRYRYTRGNCVT